MLLKPATTRDCGEVVQFNAGIIGIFIMRNPAVDKFYFAQLVEDIIRKGGKNQEN